MTLSVVYLARGKDAGFPAAYQFIEFYEEYDPGCDHELLIIMKGWEEKDKNEIDILRNKFLSLGSKILDLEDDGYDWGAYMRAVRIISTDFVCFLNCFSRPLKDNWLKNLQTSINGTNVGMSGATGSYKAWRFSMPLFQYNFFSIILYPLRILKRLRNHFMLSGFYPSSFAPHLRSNGFIIKCEDFIDFTKNIGIPKTKVDCYKLESGSSSLSNYVIQNGKRLLLVDKEGKSHDVEDWPTSNICFCPGQSELAIADNYTDLYNKHSSNMKRKMEHDIWGVTLS